MNLTNTKIIGYKPSTCFWVIKVILIHIEPKKKFCTEKSATHVFVHFSALAFRNKELIVIHKCSRIGEN